VEDVPDATVAGLNVTPETTGEVTVRVAVAVVLLTAAVIVEVPLNGSVVTVNVAGVAPDGIVTVAGTVARPVFDEVRVTGYPAVGAALEMVTVPVDGEAPATLAGLRARVTTVGAVTLKVFEIDVVPVVPVTGTATDVPTAWVEAVNVAVDAPAATVTEPGTVTAELPEDSETVVPPVGA
jgi:hypothetical protein